MSWLIKNEMNLVFQKIGSDIQMQIKDIPKKYGSSVKCIDRVKKY